MRILEVKGSLRDVGETVGEATREDVRFVRDAVVPYLLAHTTAGNRERMQAIADRHLAGAAGIYAPAVDYLRGLAYGSGCPLEDIALIAFSEEISASFLEKPPEKCSTLVVRTPDGWVLGHNEDYEPHYLGRMFILDLRLPGMPRTVSLNYPGQLPNAVCLNANGLAIANNSLWPRAMPGLSNNVKLFRATLSLGMGEALNFLCLPPSAMTSHYTVISGWQHWAMSVEVSHPDVSRAEMVLRSIGREPFIHTNHVRYLDLFEPDPALVSRGPCPRYRKLEHYAAARRPDSPEAMLDLLAWNDGLVNRTAEQCPTSVTLATLVMRPETRELWIRDCGSPPQLHRFAL